MIIFKNVLNQYTSQPLKCTFIKLFISRCCSTNEKVQTVPTQKSLNIAIIGVPNAGKSTFINNVINHRVCPTSCKVHTTRKANNAIYTLGETQLVFYDTPGLVSADKIRKHKLEKTFQSSYKHAIQRSDIIAVVHDISNRWTRKELHPTVTEALQLYSKLPSILILNKVDAIKSKRITLELIRSLTNDTLCGLPRKEKTEDKAETNIDKNKTHTSWSNFSEVFIVSAINGTGLREIRDYFLASAKVRCWQYAKDTFTEETPENLIVASVKARLLDYLPQEIPYNLKTYLEYFNLENNTLYISVDVQCPTIRIERLICGESNGRLRQITERVSSDLVETFGKPVSLTIVTRPKEKQKLSGSSSV